MPPNTTLFGYGQNLGQRFVATGDAPGSDADVIQAIMDAHAKLVAADQAGGNSAASFKTNEMPKG